MTNINHIYTTVSEGRVHIAIDDRYVNSVDSYNNCFTQFFAWLFNCSITVYFDGKARSINKKSYTDLIQTLVPRNEIRNIDAYRVFRSVAETATLPTTDRKMRDVIAMQDRHLLFQKLTLAIYRGDTAKAELLIGKGAALDIVYFDRDQLPPSLNHDSEHLSSQKKYHFTVFKAPPILQAARKGHLAVCQLLEKFGATVNVTGTEYTFQREITSVRNEIELVKVPHHVSHHYHTQDSQGHALEIRDHHLEQRTHWQQRTIIDTQDSRSDHKQYQLTSQPHPQESHHTQFRIEPIEEQIPIATAYE